MLGVDLEVAVVTQCALNWTQFSKHVINLIVYGLKPLDTLSAPTQVT